MPFKKGNTFGGRRGRSSNINRTPTSRVVEEPSDDEVADEDEEMDDAPPEDGDEDAGTPAPDEDEDPETPPTVTTIPRRRRGRGGARLSSRMKVNTPEPAEDGSESGTPFKRRRGRPPGSGAGRGRGGFRGRRKGQQPEAPRLIDQNGNVLEVINDEAQVDDDEEGDAKVDEKGNLLGGRMYRVRTFTIVGRDERLYMLSTEPARCCGFRDSYLFFAKHPKLYKVLLNETEKKDLIDRDILPSSYKGRNIGVVTARSVFREFGARIIVGGKKVTDDYKATEARANGEIEGELADPNDRIPENSEDYDRNRYVAWFGASDVYRTGNQNAIAGQPGKPGLTGKRRNNITVQNWQHLHAREASRFNTDLTALRNANLHGTYDSNTNMMFYPKIMQPTHARWEVVPPTSHPTTTKPTYPLPNGLPNGRHDPSPTNPTPQNHFFTPIPPILSRTFTIVDTSLSSPPISAAGYPGPDGALIDPTSGTNGLSSVSEEIAALLPPSCRAAFEQARNAEREWKSRWASEGQGAAWGHLTIGFTGYPV